MESGQDNKRWPAFVIPDRNQTGGMVSFINHFSQNNLFILFIYFYRDNVHLSQQVPRPEWPCSYPLVPPGLTGQHLHHWATVSQKTAVVPRPDVQLAIKTWKIGHSISVLLLSYCVCILWLAFVFYCKALCDVWSRLGNITKLTWLTSVQEAMWKILTWSQVKLSILQYKNYYLCKSKLYILQYGRMVPARVADSLDYYYY